MKENNIKERGRVHSTSLGQAMVEALVALSVIIVGILAVFTLTSTSISVNRIDADRYVAINLAKEGIELVKNLLDRNIVDGNAPWNNLPGFQSGSTDYEIDYNDNALSLYDGKPLYFGKNGGGYKYDSLSGSGDILTSFSRKINIKNIDDSHIKITSIVYWKSKNVSYDFTVVDYFYDLKELKWNLNH
jgi:type II secretory pathway pseudopilin PulG